MKRRPLLIVGIGLLAAPVWLVASLCALIWSAGSVILERCEAALDRSRKRRMCRRMKQAIEDFANGKITLREIDKLGKEYDRAWGIRPSPTAGAGASAPPRFFTIDRSGKVQ